MDEAAISRQVRYAVRTSGKENVPCARHVITPGKAADGSNSCSSGTYPFGTQQKKEDPLNALSLHVHSLKLLTEPSLFHTLISRSPRESLTTQLETLHFLLQESRDSTLCQRLRESRV